MKKMLKLIISYTVITVCLCLVFILPCKTHATSAAGFSAGRIIDDAVFTNKKSMNASQIQAFLNSKVPTCDTWGTQASEYGGGTRAQWGAAHGYSTPFTCLKDYIENGKTSAQIIYDTAQEFAINPQVIITLLQKEQALVTDTWPTSTQYRSATGYGCPDTAACDAQYYGLTNQIRWSARMFRAILDNTPTWYTPYILGNNYIRWNPNESCGGSTVNIQNRSTQALYNYTPYQPNQAALNAGYGSGNSCSAYGNRNFYLYFTDWFGSTFDNIKLEKGSTGSTVYVVYDNKKQGIPSQDVLNAWGLDKLPIYSVEDSVINSIPDGGILTRLVKNPFNPSMLLLADNGGFFNAWPNMIQNYGINPNTASTITPTLLTMSNWSANLSTFMSTPSGSGIYMVDNGSKHLFSTYNLYDLWSGNSKSVSTISDSLFNTITTGQAVFANLAVDQQGNQYVIDNGSRHLVPPQLQNAYYNSNRLTVSNQLLSLINQLPNMTSFIKTVNSAGIFLVDSGKKHGFNSIELLLAYTPAGQNPSVTILSSNALDQIPSDVNIDRRFVSNSSDSTKVYILDKKLSPANSQFQISSYSIQLSPETLSRFNTDSNQISCGSANGFIKTSNSPGIFMLENGKKRPIFNIYDFLMLNDSKNVCILNDSEMNLIPEGSQITPLISNNGTTYLLDGASKYTVSDQLISSLSNINITTVDSSTIANYKDSGSLERGFHVNNKYVFLSDNGKYNETFDQTIAQLWSIGNTTHSQYFLNRLIYSGELTKFAKPANLSSNFPIYIVDNGKFILATNIDNLYNSGYTGQKIVDVNQNYLNQSTNGNWQGYLAKDSSNGSIYVLESGKKHLLRPDLYDNWLGNDRSIVPTSLSTAYLNTLYNSDEISKAINTYQPGIYGINDGKKAGIPNMITYILSYQKSTYVNQSLVNSIPNGPVINSR